MKKKLIMINILIILVSLFLSGIAFAKYKLDNETSLQVYIDKTPPIIKITSDDKNGTYTSSDLENIIKNNCEITIDTSDNIAIKQNEYIYNPTTKDFSNITATPFSSGTKITDDGYYKIRAIDTSGNVTEIIVLIDKTAPDVKVQYFKKGERVGKVEVFSVAGTKRQLLAGAGTSADAYNESDLRNAINNKVNNIRIWTSINCSSPLTINYNVTIYPATNENAIRYSGYNSFITVQNGGTLTLQSVVIDTRGQAAGHNLTSLNVQSGGKVVFKESSIVDGGSGNTGMLLNSGASADIYSCHFAFCNKGIIAKGNSNLNFGNLSDGRNSEFWNNTTAISYEGFTGTSNINQGNIKIRDNTHGIVVESNTGTINMSAGSIYNNSSNGIFTKNGTFNISGGSIYSNGNGINFGAGTLNISGSTIYSNSNGIYLNPSYSGKMTISNVNIKTNSQYAIYHDQEGDGNCTITGGTISGNIYLAKNDNYVNTNSSYPTFTVKPSTYYFKRKLVKTTNNDTANAEISKVTLVPNSNWYKYVDNEYIVVWRGCNVKVKCVDYYGNVLSNEVLTGNLGESYETTPKSIDGYDLISSPANASGTYTENDITVEYKYDLVNCALVTYEDLLSGVQSAKYWFNANEESFTGNGIDFENNKVFEEYGFYKVEVINNVGLKKELVFSLNKNSLVR